MNITATQIAIWAATREAQSTLPRIMRRLFHASGAGLTGIDMPAGDSISSPGWDGEATAQTATPWIPQGRVCCEMSCEGASTGNVTTKANADYAKRLRKASKKRRALSTYIAVTARKWNTKKKWSSAKSIDGWKEVRAYDADDLEQWLETSPAVAVWFAEQLGLQGVGVESLEQTWNHWSCQATPPISAAALFINRETSRDAFIERVHEQLDAPSPATIVLSADSVSEAAAFACAAILIDRSVADSAVVVTEPAGWRFVGQNEALRLVIAGSPEVAEQAPVTERLVVVVPFATSDPAVRSTQEGCGISVERPRVHEFENALIGLGMDHADAARQASSTGRSWSVWRRQHATNPAMRHPAWLDANEAWALPVAFLIGAWSGLSSVDRQAVEAIADKPYEELERALRVLAAMDDSPVLHIEPVWRAKSPLELLDLIGDRITSEQLDRFFAQALDTYSTEDPILAVAPEEQAFASLRGKVRPESSFLLKGLGTSLVILAVHGPRIPSLEAAHISILVEKLVRELLHRATAQRWLSLAGYLPLLAEAAPRSFLDALDQSISQPSWSVARLFEETTDSALVGGRCWHAELLWALELLAWSPEYLARVALILARLSTIEIKGNWMNAPQASLFGIFRSWLPQTAASLDERLTVLDLLIEREPAIAFTTLAKLSYVGRATASPAHRPLFRGYDTGAGQGAFHDEIQTMVTAAIDRLIAKSNCSAERISRVVSSMDSFTVAQRQAATEMLEAFSSSSADDEEKEQMRAALRKRLLALRENGSHTEEIKSLEDQYEALAPKNLVIRYRWLFAEWSPSCPGLGDRRDHKRYRRALNRRRECALQEVIDSIGFDGVAEFASACREQPLVGVTLAELGVPVSDLAAWIVAHGGEFNAEDALLPTIRGLLGSLPWDRSREVLNAVMEIGNGNAWTNQRIAQFLVLAPARAELWEVVDELEPAIRDEYWSLISPFHLQVSIDDSEYPVRQLLRRNRPRSALRALELDLKRVDPGFIAEVLEPVAAGEEPEMSLPDPWALCRAIEHLEDSEDIDRDVLARLEFRLLPALGFHGEQRTHALIETLVSDPVVFAELVCRVYLPASPEEVEPASDEEQHKATVAFSLLRNCRRLPGTLSDGSIDAASLISFVGECRRRCETADRLTVCDQTLGQILAWAPVGSDGVWPCEAVRGLLEQAEMNQIRRGFSIGVHNKRGVVTKTPWEGGDQERTLAAQFHEWASRLQFSHPLVAAMLGEIAAEYDHEATSEDQRAKLRAEEH